jgi:hypothetical protein
VVGRNPGCRKEGCRESPVAFDALERCPFRRYSEGLHLLEEVLIRVWHGSSFAASFSEALEALADPRDIFATLLLVFVVLVPFFLAKGMIEILGKDETKRPLLKG